MLHFKWYFVTCHLTNPKDHGISPLLSFLTGTVRVAIWLTRRNKTQNSGCVDLVPVFEGLLKSQLKVEYLCYKMRDKLQDFIHMWAVGGVLWSVESDGDLII